MLKNRITKNHINLFEPLNSDFKTSIKTINGIIMNMIIVINSPSPIGPKNIRVFNKFMIIIYKTINTKSYKTNIFNLHSVSEPEHNNFMSLLSISQY